MTAAKNLLKAFIPARLRRAIRLRRLKAFVLQSGLFDQTHYLDTYPDVRSAGVDPVIHYLTVGWREGRDPSPHFETRWYLACNSDVATSGENPLVHYIRYGRAERREPTQPASPIKPNRLRPAVAGAASDLRIAIQAHIFYPDLAEELLDACLNAHGAQVLVSAASRECADAATSWAKRRSFQGLSVKLIPNRGRNVAGFAHAFAKELLEYDLFCHIHTKKSLYSGKEQLGWRQHNVSNLLGSHNHVASIVELFASNPQLGVAYPIPFPGAPYWAFTWLSSRGAGIELARMLGVPLQLSGYIQYPLGCMFWARPSAVWQLLDGRIGIESFPEEGGQTDGTLAHAIERAIAMLAEANGFRWAEIDKERGQYTLDWSERNVWQYRQHHTYSSFLEAIDKAETVCFDIFDTLLTRLIADPDDLFRMAECLLDRECGRKTEFMAERKHAESRIRSMKTSGDVTFSEIYEEMSRTDRLEKLSVKNAAQLEHSLECRLMRPRQRVIQGLDHALARGKRVILASDMYLEREQVAALLEGCGVQGYHEMYLSSHTGLRKDSLTLWHHLIEKENAASERFLHIGDNEQSDVQLPQALGVPYYHVMSPRSLFEVGKLAHELRPILKREGRLPAALGPFISSYYNDPFEGRD